MYIKYPTLMVNNTIKLTYFTQHHAELFLGAMDTTFLLAYAVVSSGYSFTVLILKYYSHLPNKFVQQIQIFQQLSGLIQQLP